MGLQSYYRLIKSCASVIMQTVIAGRGSASSKHSVCCFHQLVQLGVYQIIEASDYRITVCCRSAATRLSFSRNYPDRWMQSFSSSAPPSIHAQRKLQARLAAQLCRRSYSDLVRNSILDETTMLNNIGPLFSTEQLIQTKVTQYQHGFKTTFAEK